MHVFYIILKECSFTLEALKVLLGGHTKKTIGYWRSSLYYSPDHKSRDCENILAKTVRYLLLYSRTSLGVYTIRQLMSNNNITIHYIIY